jgi:formate hydrogenlyase subunit 6/NADH:ubiquinone oxidoreductase subunit I
VTKVIAKICAAVYSAFVQKAQQLIVPRIEATVCSGCGWCFVLCPTRAVELVEGRADIARPADCVFCDVCETCCPEGAIQRAFLVEFADMQKKTGLTH